jgi:fibronectin type 3 domain-containing protein
MPVASADGQAPTDPPDGTYVDKGPRWTQSPVPDMGGRFTENLGQWDARTRFVTDTPFGHAVFGANGVTYDVVREGGGHRVKVAFTAETTVAPEGVDDLGYDTNFFLGNDPEGWVTGARTYREIIYRDVWPGVDIRYHFAGGDLKYDVLLDSDADPSMVRFDVIGGEGLEVDDGHIDIQLSRGLTIQDRDLVAWYSDGEVVDVGFEERGNGFGFALDKEPGRALVIDPIVVHSSTLVGGTYTDSVLDVELDGDGNIYVIAYSQSDDYPMTTGAYDDEIDAADAAVTKFNHNCSQVIWSTFVGGSSWDFVAGLELDERNNVYFAGATWSHDFPTTKNALNSLFNLGLNNYQQDPYVVKLSSLGNDLAYSTYVGGSHTEWVGDIKVKEGKATVVGQTQSGDFPTESGSYGGVHGDGFLFTLNENGSRIVDTWFWGGFGSELTASLEHAPNDEIVVVGRTTSMDMYVTPNAFQPTRPCFSSGFVARYSPTANRLVVSTFFGGGMSTQVNAVTVDDDLNIYIAGNTFSGGAGDRFVTTPGAFDEEYNGRYDGFLAKMDPNGTRLEYCTLIGGDGEDEVYDVELDAEGHLVAVGTVGIGTNFTVTPDAFDTVWEGDSEGFVFILNDNGSAPLYSTFLGGQFGDGVGGVEIDDVDNLVVAGATQSKDFPINESAFQRKIAGDFDGFISIIGEFLPTSAPVNLTAKGGEGYIELGWEMPANDRGYPVREFLLFRGLNESTMRFEKALDPVEVYVDAQVEWGVYYHYAVYASNGKGISPRSNVAIARSVTVPDPPLNMTGSVMFDSVVIGWEPPAFKGGLEVTGYMLYRIAEGDHVELVIPIAANVWSFEDEAVEDGTNYTYTLTALNEYGESLERVSITLRTHDVPTPPVDLNHTYGDLFIRLTWAVPKTDNGLPVTTYTVHRQTWDGPPEEVGEVAPPLRVFVDSQVDVGTLYSYFMTARNAKGDSGPSEVIEAMAMVPPDPPTGVEAVASEHFVKVTWDAPGFDGASSIQRYRVYLGESMDDAVCLGGPSTQGTTEPQLLFLHDVAYDGIVRSYFVTAVNAEGESGSSTLATTVPYQVPGAPEDLQVEWGEGRLEVGWSPPTSDGGTPILSYTLYRMEEGEDDFTLLAILTVEELGHIDLDTTNGLEYSYRMTATNLAGVSEPCSPVSAVPAGLPGSPLDLLAVGGIGSVRVTWGPPSDDGGHPVDGYRLYRMEEGGQMILLAELGSEVEEFLDEGVDNGIVYLYSVSAFTDVGPSVASDASTAIAYGHPGQPVNLVARWVDGQVQLSWSAPGDDGGSGILGYRIHRKDTADDNVTEVLNDVLTIQDADVESGATYAYTVYALNAAGTGTEAEVSITVPLPEPDPPETAPDSIWAFLVVAVVLVAAAMLLVVMRRRGGLPGQAIL